MIDNSEKAIKKFKQDISKLAEEVERKNNGVLPDWWTGVVEPEITL